MKRLLFYGLLSSLLFACETMEDGSDYSGGYYQDSYYSEVPNDNPNPENQFIETSEEPTSTFSTDADGGSYAYAKNKIQFFKTLPSPADVRIEEFLNYFDYDYPTPTDAAIGINTEVSTCPWNDSTHLLRIGIKGKQVSLQRIPANFVFLIDVSGSMSGNMSLIRTVLGNFKEHMNSNDYMSIVTYASSPGTLLTPTNGNDKSTIQNVIDRLYSAGSTNGSGGINAAYTHAQSSFISSGNNRIIMITDGDFNVGVTNQTGLISLIEEKRETGIYLTTIGVGNGNYQEEQMEQIANHGNGTYEYMANEEDGNRILIEKAGRLFTVATDVKVQVSFNVNSVKRYRLIGYENRLLENEDFEDDTKDAAEIGAEQTVTALYELELYPDNNEKVGDFDFRFKEDVGEASLLINHQINQNIQEFGNSSINHQLAGSIAAYGMILSNSSFKGNITYDDIINWKPSLINDDFNEFYNLVQDTKSISN